MERGKVSGNVLKRSVLRQIGIKREEVVSGAGIGADCAIFSCADGERLVTCMQEAAVHWAESKLVPVESELSANKPEHMEPKTSVYGGDVTDSELLVNESENIKSKVSVNESENAKSKLPVNESECAKPEVSVDEPEPYITLAQLIQKCANNIAVSGAQPVAFMLTLLLPENTEEYDIKALLSEAEQKGRELSMMLMGGQTRISGQVMSPHAVAAGYGKIRAERNHTVKVAAPGQDLVISKWIGLQGTAVLAKRNREKLLERIPCYLVEEAAGFDRYLSIIPEAAAAVKSGVCAMHDASEGGIFAALWELAEGAGVGLNIDMRKLPIRQETVEVCECCNVNPYELLSGGCLLMTTDDGLGLVEALAAEHIPAVIVGRVTEGRGRILRNGDEIRYLDRPKQDQLYKIQ